MVVALHPEKKEKHHRYDKNGAMFFHGFPSYIYKAYLILACFGKNVVFIKSIKWAVQPLRHGYAAAPPLTQGRLKEKVPLVGRLEEKVPLV